MARALCIYAHMETGTGVALHPAARAAASYGVHSLSSDAVMGFTHLLPFLYLMTQ